jgi:DNA-binding NarL/FixJ family response regulator
LCSSYQPDLLLIVFDGWEDLLMPVVHRLSPVNILGLSPPNEQICHTLIRQNVINGCLPETAPPEVLAQAIHAVASGYTWFSQALFKQILHPTLQTGHNQPVLTNQELAVLRLVMQERKNKHIGHWA